MGFKEWIIPQDSHFFDMLEEESKTVIKGADLLLETIKIFYCSPQRRKEIKTIENDCDNIVHEIMEALNLSFITPIDQEDIRRLASALDDVLDLINSVSNRLCLYNIKPEWRTGEFVRLSEIVVKQAIEVDKALKGLRKMKNPKEIEKRCIEVNRLENEADDLFHNSLAKLFEMNDPVAIIKLKELYENMEACTDCCEDAANVISDIVAKNV